MSTEKEIKSFMDAQKEAESMLKDPNKSKAILEKALKKSSDNKSVFDDIWDDLQALIRMVRAYRKGDYTQISKKSIILVGGALVYLVNPLDIIPDIAPLVGLLDDFTIIGYVINTVRQEVKDFLAWEDSIITEEIAYEEKMA